MSGEVKRSRKSRSKKIDLSHCKVELSLEMRIEAKESDGSKRLSRDCILYSSDGQTLFDSQKYSEIKELLKDETMDLTTRREYQREVGLAPEIFVGTSGIECICHKDLIVLPLLEGLFSKFD